MKIVSITFKFLWLFATALCFTVLAFGQDFEETGLAADATLTRQSNARQSPTVNSAKLATLAPAAEIRIIDNTRRNGYLRVLFGNGEQGYIYYKNIKTSEESSKIAEAFKRVGTETLLAERVSDEPCVNTGFGGCPPRGCYAPNSPGALFNEAKRRPPVGVNPLPISFADLERMQVEIGNRLGIRSQNQSLSAAEREKLKNIRVTNGVVGEGALVKIIGFIPAVGDGLKGGSIETVNCKFREPNQRDIHIPLAEQFSKTEFEGIVIEMIPQNRPPGWTLQKLRKVWRDKRKVMVVGGLFYDNEHLVNRNPARPLSGHSKRFSIWEIHPVTQFFVCGAIDNSSCSAAGMSGWIPLERFQ